MDQSLCTPAVVIDLATVRQNINKLAAWSKAHRIAVRPHTKTHKSIRMARMQLDAGAIGLAVAKAGEAEVMAQAENDILVAYPACDPHRSHQLAHLAQSKTIRVACDSQFAIESLANAARAEGST